MFEKRTARKADADSAPVQILNERKIGSPEALCSQLKLSSYAHQQPKSKTADTNANRTNGKWQLQPSKQLTRRYPIRQSVSREKRSG